jgi:hypothetical protein
MDVMRKGFSVFVVMLKKSIDQDKASPPTRGLAERGFLKHRFSACIQCAIADGNRFRGSFDPVWN